MSDSVIFVAHTAKTADGIVEAKYISGRGVVFSETNGDGLPIFLFETTPATLQAILDDCVYPTLNSLGESVGENTAQKYYHVTYRCEAIDSNDPTYLTEVIDIDPLQGRDALLSRTISVGLHKGAPEFPRVAIVHSRQITKSEYLYWKDQI